MNQSNAKSNMGLLVLVLVTILWADSNAQPSCQAPIASLQSCVGFITGSSVGPVQDCCTQLATMIQTQSHCLCTFLNAMPQIPLPFNRTQAITLPGVCNIQAPPLSQCDSPAGTSVPAAGSPEDASAPASDALPAAPGGVSPPSVTGVPTAKGASKTGPTTTKGQSSSSSPRSSTMLSSSSFLFFFPMALFFSSF